MHGENKKCRYKKFRKLEEERPLGRPRHERKNNIKMDLKEVRCDV
jgi:hypothetical protein